MFEFWSRVTGLDLPEKLECRNIKERKVSRRTMRAETLLRINVEPCWQVALRIVADTSFQLFALSELLSHIRTYKL